MKGERVYRALLWLYPPSFRREYGPQMLQLHRDARRNRVASWPRLAGDVVLTLPRQYQEAFMNLDRSRKLGALALVLTTGVVALVVLGGAVLALVLALVLAGTLVAFLQSRGAAVNRGSWWKFAASGIGLLALIFIVFALPWPQSWRAAVPAAVGYWTVVFGAVCAIVLMATGLIAGIVELATRRHPRAA